MHGRFEENNRGLKISLTKVSRNFIVIVIVYAKGVNRGIINKAFIIVYIEL